MTDKELLKNSSLFDSDFYRTQYQDVEMIGMDPIEHYLWLGWRLNRDPSLMFSTSAYLDQHVDVAQQKINPLVHYERNGRHEGRQVLYSRLYALKIDEMRRRAEQDQSSLVSAIMPAFNREATVSQSIASVIAQTYHNFELIVVDDGSTDRTCEIVSSFLSDPRIKLIKGKHEGVSAARNLGLKAASGSIIAYLDSDNIWVSEYLSSMVGYMNTTGSDVAYSQIEIVNDAERIIRGEVFDRKRLLKGNFIDLNVYCHTKHLYETCGGFDETLRRMVDWDLIIRQTAKAGKIGYVPFVGCEYSNTTLDPNRISVKEFRAFRKVVIAKAEQEGSSSPLADYIKLNFAIKIPAPYEKREEWGDFHYADSLAGSLNRLGHKVRIDFHGKWERPNPAEDDVVILIRGLDSYKPIPGQISILWNISHPDQVEFEEYERFDLAYVASLSYTDFLSATSSAKVRALLQATDIHRFNPKRKPIEKPADILFVGNSRNEYRDVVRWSLEEGLNLSVYGTRWDQFIPSTYIKGINIPNRELGSYYHSANIVLNDHWPSMRNFGFVSNRIFDVLSAGGRIISDEMPAISYVFGDAVKQVGSQAELAVATRSVWKVDSLSLSAKVMAEHSFDSRARTILTDIFALLGVNYGDPPSPFVLRKKRLIVNGVIRQDREFPQSSAFIRLLCPLTTDAAYGDIDFKLIPAKGVCDSRRADINIVQRTAFDNIQEASTFLERIRSNSSKLIVDNDDAFCYMDEKHPEFELYQPRINGFDLLLGDADANWVSTDVLKEAYAYLSKQPIVMSNAIDPRLWLDYRKPPQHLNEIPELVYAGTATHDSDFSMIIDALDTIALECRFNLTIIGAVRNPPQKPWIKVITPPRHAQSYPRFVRWFRKQGPFDIGLAPLVDTPFNSAKSDLKLLDYGALRILPLASRCPSYEKTIKTSKGGMLVENTNIAWTLALRDVITNINAYSQTRDTAEKYAYQVRNVTKAYSDMHKSLIGL